MSTAEHEAPMRQRSKGWIRGAMEPLVAVMRSLHAACIFALLLVTIAVALNAWTYSYANGIPLVQADAWVFLDTYVRSYLQGQFGWRDFFLQGHSSDTNLPLHKLILLLHINHFNMDFKVEGLIGVLSGVAMVLLLSVSAAGAHLTRWKLPEFTLLAWLMLVLLSLNSSNIYTWPLATMWFLNLLLVSAYLLYMTRPVVSPGAVLAATIVMGLLLDEVALITVAAGVSAVLFLRDAGPVRERFLQSAAAITGLLLVRGFYWWFNSAHGVVPEAISSPGLLQNLGGLVSSQGLQLVVIPLVSSVVQQSALMEWHPTNHLLLGNFIGAIFFMAHLWFWWQVFALRGFLYSASLRTRRMAIALMVFFYGTVAGIALQRVPEFGIDYLHQPRYVIFYQLHLAALALMAYSVFRHQRRPILKERLAGGLLLGAVLAMGTLQWHLSARSWEHAKYLSVYVEGVAATMGQLAANPGVDRTCADILTVCDFPAAKRQELMYILQNYQLNIFNADFQALYRLRPFPPERYIVPARDSHSGKSGADAPGG